MSLFRWLLSTSKNDRHHWGIRAFRERRERELAERTRRDEAVGAWRPPFWEKPWEEREMPRNVRTVK